jgi:hypothetical protein
MARDGIADVTYVNPGLPARPLPDHRRRRIAVPDVGRQGRLDGARRLVPQICREGDEGRQVLPRLRPFALVVPFATKKIVVPEDIKGMKDPSRPRHHGQFRDPARRHQRAVVAPEVRDIIERGVADAVTFPWGSLLLFGIDKVTKYDMEAPLYVTTFALVNKDKYNQMSDKQKKAIDNNCNTETAGKVGEHWGKMEDAGIDRSRRSPATRSTSSPPSKSDLEEGRRALGQNLGRGPSRRTDGDPDAALA